MCFLFGTDINVEVIASKMGSLFQLDTTIAETEILKKWHSAKIQGNHWDEGRDLGATTRGVSQHKKMCSQFISPFWINLALWVCIFSHEDNKVQIYCTMTNDHLWPAWDLQQAATALTMKNYLPPPNVKSHTKVENEISCTNLWKTCHWSTLYLGIK
jgi:hypothetical protein